MKRFKRISIILSIFILLIWSFASVMIIYPMNHVHSTKNDIAQTKVILTNNGISVSDKILSESAVALPCPTINYRTQDAEKLINDILGANAIQKNDTTYMAKNTELSLEENNKIKITGLWEGFENISIENVAGKASKLIKSFDLNKMDMSVHAYPKNNGFYVILVPEYRNRSLFDCCIELNIKNDSSYTLDALPIELSKPIERKLSVTACEALSELALSGKTYSTAISDIALGYIKSGDTLKPAWKILAENGETFYIDN